MKLVAPVLLALSGLGVGVAAGVALKPAPEACAEGPCAPPPVEEAGAAVVALERPLVAPVFAEGRVAAMVVVSVAVALPEAHAAEVGTLAPRLRDAFLQAMFVHANSGGFDGAFTGGRPMEDLRGALLGAARQVFGATPVADVLITEIARQDM